MEERDFFHELCPTVLASDRNIRFAGVIDDDGKLVVGEYRNDIETPLIRSNIVKSQGNGTAIVDASGGNSTVICSSFRASKMIFALNKQFEYELGHLNYHLTEYDKVKLLTLALSSENNCYLCVSLDPVKDCQRVVDKVLESI